MKILVACEESQAVTKELRALGHLAFSCDLQECSGGHPEWHIQGDALKFINGNCIFMTADGEWHSLYGTWDMLIAHPPCTYLTSSSAVRLFNKDHSIKDPVRYQLGIEAAKFFLAFYNADCPRVAIENPTPLKCFGLPAYTQIIEPFMFGDPWRKRTCLWLRGLPPLCATNPVRPEGLWVGSSSQRHHPGVTERYKLHSNRNPKIRSKTFPGIAKAMAEEWAGRKE